MTASTGVTPAHRQLGAALRQCRNRKGLSLAQVEADSAGEFTAVTVGSYERADRAISVPRLLQLAEFYGVPAASLLPGEGAGTGDQARAQALEEFADWARSLAADLRGDARREGGEPS